MHNNKYSKDGQILVWDETLCVNAKQCLKRLPAVFDRSKEPWIDLSSVNLDEVIQVVQKCPTGALRFENLKLEQPDITGWPEIRVMKDGPLIVMGEVELTKDGAAQRTMKMMSFCRCGHSGSMPYCDGTHRKYDFRDGA